MGHLKKFREACAVRRRQATNSQGPSSEVCWLRPTTMSLVHEWLEKIGAWPGPCASLARGTPRGMA